MTKPQLAVAAVVGWIAIHGGLVLLGGVLGVGLSIPFLPHSTNSQAVYCQEDEVAIHGGLADWYDPDLPLACVNFDEFPELHPFDYEQWRAEIYRDGFLEGYNEGLSDATNTEIGEAWSEPPAPEPTPTPAPPTPESKVDGPQMTVALTFYTCEPFCIGDTMANGQPLHDGAVACGWGLQTGQRFLFAGQEFTCEDRGGGGVHWVDFWMPDYDTGLAWQASVGQVGEITLVMEDS